MSTELPDPQENETVADDFLEIRDPGVDSQQLMKRINERMDRRRHEADHQLKDFPSYGGVPFPGIPEGEIHDPNLYHHLRLANKLYIEVETEPKVENSPATRIPVLGQLWGLVRLHAHNLVLFYVNRAIRHEVDVNRHLVSVLNSLTLANHDQQMTISELRNEIEELRSKDGQ